jgi:hypothetical protein
MKKDKVTGPRSPAGMPWWGSVLLAVCCYCGLKYLVPALHPSSPFLQKLAEAAPSFAPIVTIPLLLLAAKQLYDTSDPPGNDKPDDREENPEDPPKG